MHLSRSSSSTESTSSLCEGLSRRQPQCSAVEIDLGTGLSVSGALRGSTILLTGASGFVGSVIVEQLLRLSDVRRVYCLVRCKQGKTAEARLQALLRTKPLFKSLLVDGELPADLRDRLVAVQGDTTLPDLGLSPEDRARLTGEVEWVVHSAASISFFSHIHELLAQNYEATARVAALAAHCPRLRGFVHVSTAYVNANLPRGSHIEEAIYPLTRSTGEKVRHAELAARLAALPAARAEKQAQALLAELRLPNSYTLTKHMCEDLLADLHGPAFPVAIVRPSIIGALAGAPLPGYFGNAAGITSATLAFATGMARFTCHNPFSVYDVIPCDVVGHCILGALPALQQEAVRRRPVLVLHACSSTTNPLLFAEGMQRIVVPYWTQAPPRHRLSNKPYKPLDAKNTWVEYDSFLFKMLTLKANVRMGRIELLLRLAGRRKVADLVKSSWKIWRLYNTPTMDFELFFCCKNATALAGALDPAEVAALRLKLIWSKEDDWWEYMLAHQVAIRAKYYPDTVEAAKAFKYEARPFTEEERLQHAVLQARGPTGRTPLFSLRRAHTVPGLRSPVQAPTPPGDPAPLQGALSMKLGAEALPQGAVHEVAVRA